MTTHSYWDAVGSRCHLAFDDVLHGFSEPRLWSRQGDAENGINFNQWWELTLFNPGFHQFYKMANLFRLNFRFLINLETICRWSFCMSSINANQTMETYRTFTHGWAETWVLFWVVCIGSAIRARGWLFSTNRSLDLWCCATIFETDHLSRWHIFAFRGRGCRSSKN